MRSSSTERPSGRRRGPFWPADAGAWVRLVLVVGLGSGAVLAPVLDRTGVIYTDTETVSFTVVDPAPTPSGTPSETPSGTPSETPSGDATEATPSEGSTADAAPSFAGLRAARLAPVAPPSESPTPTPLATPADGGQGSAATPDADPTSSAQWSGRWDRPDH